MAEDTSKTPSAPNPGSTPPSTARPSTGSSSGPRSGGGSGSGRGGRPGGRSGGGRPGGGGRDRGRRGGGGGRRFYRRRKVCRFCVDRVDYVDYKDPQKLEGFCGDRGKILPRRLTGVCTVHQRQLKIAIKRARNCALLPFAAAQ